MVPPRWHNADGWNRPSPDTASALVPSCNRLPNDAGELGQQSRVVTMLFLLFFRGIRTLLAAILKRAGRLTAAIEGVSGIRKTV